MLTLEGNGGWSIGHGEDTWSDEKGRKELARWAICSLYGDTRRKYLIDMCYCSNLNLIRNMYRCSCIVFDGFDQ